MSKLYVKYVFLANFLVEFSNLNVKIYINGNFPITSDLKDTQRFGQYKIMPFLNKSNPNAS